MNCVKWFQYVKGRRSSGVLRRVTIVLWLASFATACSLDTEQGSADTNEGPVSQLPSAAEEVRLNSPLSDALGTVVGPFSLSDPQLRAQRLSDEQAAIEDRIVECMAQHGFDYRPQTAPLVGVPSDDGLPYLSDEWIGTFGFGVSTLWFAQSDLPPGLRGRSSAQRPLDPNEQIRGSLGESELEEYMRALDGDPVILLDATEEDFAEFQNQPPDGCRQQAAMQIRSDSAAFVAQFGEDLADLERRFNADPRVVDYDRLVSACVAASGYSWQQGENPRARFEPMVQELIGASGDDPFAEAGLDPSTMSQDEIEQFLRGLTTLGPDKLEQLAQVQSLEIELATTVQRCGGGALVREHALGRIREEFEMAFLAEHHEPLVAAGLLAG